MATAEEIKAFVEDQIKKTKPLRDRMEDTYDLWRLEPFKFPDVDGKPVTDYQIMTTNKPRVFADKVISELAFGTLKLRIPIYKETKKERTDESMTEQTVYGLIAMADDRARSFTLPCIQAQVADDIFKRGFTVPRVWIYKEEDKVIVDVAMWDARNVYWLVGSKGLKRVCNIRYTTKEEVKDLYPKAKDITEDASGGVTLYDHWDDTLEQVVVGDKIVYTMKHNRGYIPVLILPVGSARQRYSSRHQDTIKDVGEDFASKVRDVARQVSQIQSYYLTIVALGTHPSLLAYHRGNEPINFKNTPYGSGSVVDLNIDKEQRIEPMFKWTMPQDTLVLNNIKSDELSDGLGPDIMYGRLAQAATAQGTAMLIRAAMGAIKNGQRAMEQTFAWTSDELVRQLKDGKFKIDHLQGIDGKQKQFNVTVEKDKLVTDRRFIASLSIDSPQDILQNIGAAAQLVSSEMISMQTARDKFLGQFVPDPDGEQDIIDGEKVSKIAGIAEFKFLDALMKDPKGNKTAILRLKAFLDQQLQQAQQAQAMLQGGQPSGENVSGIPKGMTPATRPPESNINQRLNRIGLQIGR